MTCSGISATFLFGTSVLRRYGFIEISKLRVECEFLEKFQHLKFIDRFVYDILYVHIIYRTHESPNIPIGILMNANADSRESIFSREREREKYITVASLFFFFSSRDRISSVNYTSKCREAISSTVFLEI